MIFDETTSAAIESYFPDRTDASGFLGLVHSWWIISNSKRRFNTRNKLGNAATKGDSKTSFFRAFADWLTMWQTEKLPNCEKFQLSQQTNSTLIRTLRCHAALMDDLLHDDEHKFVLTARFQSDPLEKRYGQYRQMSGGRFLVSLREVESSEKILTLKSLLKENCDWKQTVCLESNAAENMMTVIEEKVEEISTERLILDKDSQEVTMYISGYIAKKL